MATDRPHLVTMPLTRENVLAAIQSAPLRLAELSTSRNWHNARTTQARAIIRELLEEGCIRLVYMLGQQRYVPADWEADAAVIRQHLEGYMRQSQDCLIWTGGRNNRGAPIFRLPGSLDRKPKHVRRWLYQQARGVTLKATVSLLPTCGNDDCVHPDHQTRRTAKQYQVGKPITPVQRANMARGVRAWRGRFKWADIEAIRASDQTYVQLAVRYGCSAALIGQIKRFEVWREYVASPWAGLERSAANDARARRRRAG